ncbi:unnamed protein product [Lymnaea stagnalis]|uniref:RING-type domain-containing protein n=1 Tax=Lymnaea stagnalis TaxID=6523 RepID=A0AAV2ILX3_LYMST
MRADEFHRIATFNNYPKASNKSALILAENGFKFIGGGTDGDDRVECVFCRCRVSDWQEGDVVHDVHKRKSPTCCMVTFWENGGIDSARRKDFPCVAQELFDRIKRINDDVVISQAGGLLEGVRKSGPQSSVQSRALRDVVSNGVPIPGLVVEKPKYPDFKRKNMRIESFANWPKTYQQNPELLSDAGLFYEDCGNLFRCFSCGKGLAISAASVDILLEHARLSPRCPFMCLKMGQNFIDFAQESKPTESSVSTDPVFETMGATPVTMANATRSELLMRDPGVQVLLEEGYPEKDILKIVTEMDNKGETTEVMTVYEKLTGLEVSKSEEMTRLIEMNKQLRLKTLCKVCTTEKASIVYFPCGHLASCLDCSDVGRDCPSCGNPAPGLIRAFIR